MDCLDESTTTTTTLPTTTTTDPPLTKIIDPSVSNTRNACSGGAKLTHFNMKNSGSANANAYFLVQYSLDGGSKWSTLVANQSVAPDSSEKASVNVPKDKMLDGDTKSPQLLILFRRLETLGPRLYS